jgi:ribonuclease D
MHRVRGRRGLAAVRALWETRDALARQRDVTPGRILPDSAIVAAAQAFGTDRPGAAGTPERKPDKQALLATKGFHGRGAERYAARWVEALEESRALPESELPTRSPRGDGPPLPRAWAEKDPIAARRLALAREAVAAVSEELSVPVENLLTPDYLRRLLWTPPATREPEQLEAAVARQLAGYGARPWQIEVLGPVLTRAIVAADAEPAG